MPDIVMDMVAITGHFDGKFIVPDEPLNLQPNQRLIVHIETVADQAVDFRNWVGMGNAVPTNPAPRFKSDADVWG
jgi:hypothetical protein